MSGCYLVICCGCCGPEEQGTPSSERAGVSGEGKLSACAQARHQGGVKKFSSMAPLSPGGGGEPTNHEPNMQALKAPTSLLSSGGSPSAEPQRLRSDVHGTALSPARLPKGLLHKRLPLLCDPWQGVRHTLCTCQAN